MTTNVLLGSLFTLSCLLFVHAQSTSSRLCEAGSSVSSCGCMACRDILVPTIQALIKEYMDNNRDEWHVVQSNVFELPPYLYKTPPPDQTPSPPGEGTRTTTARAVRPTRSGPPRDCSEISSSSSGVYVIHPEVDSVNHSIEVYCDMQTAGGGWTVFQRRRDDSVDFYRGWDEYKNGFGDPRGDLWLGNKYLHAVSAAREQQLWIDLADFDNRTAYAKYRTFSVASEDDNFRLEISSYSGNAGDSMRYSNGYEFATRDRDNEHQCAARYQGAWWYNACFWAHLNGQYYPHGRHVERSNKHGILWMNGFRGREYSLAFSEMKMRPIY